MFVLLVCVCAPQLVGVQVYGMTCGACVSAVEKALRSVHGVTHVGVSLTAGEAEVQMDTSARPPVRVKEVKLS